MKTPSLYYAYIRDCRKKMAQGKSPVEKAFWNRAAEHAAKLALVAHTGTDIDDTTFDWAVALSGAQTQAMIDNIEANISENGYEADLKRVLKVIGEGNVTKNEITRKTQWLDRRRRQDILDNLVESGMIAKELDDTKGRPLTRYVRTM
jgi:predicted ArsR family transcriptional regulator